MNNTPLPIGFTTLLSGSDIGKSWLALALSLCATVRRPFATIAPSAHRVLYYSTQDCADLMRGRVKQCCIALDINPARLDNFLMVDAHHNPVLYHEATGHDGLHDTAMFGHLRRRILNHKAELVVIDSGLDTFDGVESVLQIKRYMRLLNRLAVDAGAAILLVCPDDNPAWSAAISSLLELSEDSTDSLTLTHRAHPFDCIIDPIPLRRAENGVILGVDTPPSASAA